MEFFKKRKKHTVEEKVKYFTNQSKSEVYEKKIYAKNWLDAYTDENAKFNLPSVKKELKARQLAIKESEKKLNDKKAEIISDKKTNKISYLSYISGAKSQLEQNSNFNKINDKAIKEKYKKR